MPLPDDRAVAAVKPQSGALDWSYEGEGGPEAWGRLKPEFAKCATGTRQSPIDIREGIRHFVALFSPLLRSPQRKLVDRMTARPAG